MLSSMMPKQWSDDDEDGHACGMRPQDLQEDAFWRDKIASERVGNIVISANSPAIVSLNRVRFLLEDMRVTLHVF